jgi:hypothetical protein
VFEGHPSNFNGPADDALAWNAFSATHTEFWHTDESTFSFISLDLISAAANGATSVHIAAYGDDGLLQHFTDVSLNEELTTTTLNWNDIDKVKIDFIGNGPWGMDNLLVV